MGAPDPMRLPSTLLALGLLATAIAGCSDSAPSGEYSTGRDDVTTNGDVILAFQERERPSDIDQACPPDGVEDPTGAIHCQDAESRVSANFMSLPEPSMNGYTLWWTGGETDVEIGSLEANETSGGYTMAEKTFPESFASYESVELRMGDVLIGSATNAEGTQTFSPNEELTQISASGTWKGRELTIDVQGTLEDVSYTAWLVSADEEGALEHEDSFDIDGEGEHTFEAERTIDTYQELHIHITGSKVNVAIADL